MSSWRVCLALMLLATVALPVAARKPKVPPTAPGKYIDWKEEIDELEIVQTFKLSDYAQVSVEPFDTENTPLPEEEDNSYKPVRAVLADAAGPFVQGLAGALVGKIAVVRGSGGTGKALLLRARVETMDPGSRSARYWAPGAGATRAKLVGEAVDAESGEVLFRFIQERRSGFGMFGGDYVEMMNRNLVAIGEDVALILAAF